MSDAGRITEPGSMPGAAELLEALGFGADTGGLVIWCKEIDGPEKPAARFDDVAAAVLWAREHAARFDVYFGQTPQLPLEGSSRGLGARAMALLHVWCDLDCFGPTHAEENLPTREEAEVFIKDLVLLPSALIWSGGGFQLHWFLKEPIVIGSEDDRRRAEALTEGWQEYLRQRLGKHLDNTSDLARVMRLPGTVNHKNGASAPVELLELFPERRYDPSDFEVWIPEQKERAPIEPGERNPKIASRLLTAAKYRVRAGKTRNDTGFWLAAQLRDAGVAIESAYQFLDDFQSDCPASNHPYTPQEARASVKSAFSRPPRDPLPGDPPPAEAPRKDEQAERAAVQAESAEPGSSKPDTTATEEPSQPTNWLSPAGVLRASPRPKARFESTLTAVNKATLGGLPTGALVAYIGIPDAGKTGIVIQEAVEIALHRESVVVIFTPDQGREATALRIGALLGLDQGKLEERDEAEIARLDEVLKERRVLLPDDCAEENTTENVIAAAEKIRPDLPHVLAIDSLQEARARGKPGDDSGEKDNVIANVRACRRATTSSAVAWLVLATSQTTKASQSRDPKSRPPAIMAGADSAKIGFATQLIVYLEGDPSLAPNYGRATVVKNKLRGPKPTFGLRLDPATTRLEEIDSAEADRQRDESARQDREKAVSKLADRALALLIASGPLNVTAIRERISAKKADLLAALDGLEAQKAAMWKPGTKNSRVWEAVIRGTGPAEAARAAWGGRP